MPSARSPGAPSPPPGLGASRYGSDPAHAKPDRLPPTELTLVLPFKMAKTIDSLLERLVRIDASAPVPPRTSSQSIRKPSMCRRPASSMALAASARTSSPTPTALKAARTVFSNTASLVSNRHVKSILLIYASEPDSQSDGGASRGVTLKATAVSHSSVPTTAGEAGN